MDFEEAERREFTEAKDVRDAFLKLGYGKEMSDCLFGQAMEMFKDETRSVSLWAVQRGVLSNWMDLRDDECIAISLQKKKIARKPAFLVYNSGILTFIRSKHNIGRGITAGFSLPPVEVAGNVAVAKQPILQEGVITSVYGAVRLLTDTPRFSNQGDDCYRPTPEGMVSITGALTLLHVLLAGRVKPTGIFKSAVPPSRHGSQEVCINLPLSYGANYSTHGTAKRGVYRHIFCAIGTHKWDISRNYTITDIVGGPLDDNAVRKAFFGEEANEVSKAGVSSKSSNRDTEMRERGGIDQKTEGATVPQEADTSPRRERALRQASDAAFLLGH